MYYVCIVMIMGFEIITAAVIKRAQNVVQCCSAAGRITELAETKFVLLKCVELICDLFLLLPLVYCLYVACYHCVYYLTINLVIYAEHAEEMCRENLKA